MTNKKLSIEESLNKIQDIVDMIENNDIELKKSLSLYSDALSIAKTTLTDLQSCEEKFTLLQKEKDQLSDD
tara:strand:+ start:185 stop:397 length:213 start_codon:yes stop_codon:yes gene_type:complete